MTIVLKVLGLFALVIAAALLLVFGVPLTLACYGVAEIEAGRDRDSTQEVL